MSSPTPERAIGNEASGEEAALLWMEERVARLRAALLEPGSHGMERIGELIPDLEQAAVLLESLGAKSGQEAAPVRLAALVRLKTELGRTAVLLDQALEFTRGWARVLGTAQGGYTGSGEAAPLTAPARVSLAG